MVKIISQPDIATWSVKKTCKYCDSVLEATVDDLTYHRPYEFRDSENISFICPVCHKKLFISSVSSIPNIILTRLRGR